MRRCAPALVALTCACGSGDDSSAAFVDPSANGSNPATIDAGPSGDSTNAVETTADDAPDAARPADASQASDGGISDDAIAPEFDCTDAGMPPSTLECTGLYANFASKRIADDVHPYAPAVPLWSDGAAKQRWIHLPPGMTIDATNPSEWTFPVGTKLWKEFALDGKRIETRLFQKVFRNYWVNATYQWNDDDSATSISFGGDVPVGADGGSWHIPVPDECSQCHRGRSDRVLGFEQVNLGLPGATGLTLVELVLQGLIAPPPGVTSLHIGDDGTGVAAPALGWLHVNCGVTCHNGNENSTGYGAGMRLRLDPALLDGRPVAGWDTIVTTANVATVSGSAMGQPRIVPGDPADSVLVRLISERGKEQMPPIASKLIDQTDVPKVVDWIAHMPLAEAGTTDGAILKDVAAEALAASDDAMADEAMANESIDDVSALVDQAAADAGTESGDDATADAGTESGDDATADENVGDVQAVPDQSAADGGIESSGDDATRADEP
jgi:hypothetical protein